jgi:hypothetical protein
MQTTLNLLHSYELIILLSLLAIVLGLFIWNIFLQKNIGKIHKKNAAFFSGSNIKNVDNLIVNHANSIKALDKDIQELYTISNQINIQARKGLHKFAIIRFNPFKDVGGDQSFAIAMLNGKNNGLTISSLYTREGTRVYAKAITNGEAEKYPLTEEEKQAIKLARATDTKKIN